MQDHVYLCSSMRHIYLAMGLAQASPRIRHHLMIINQKTVNPAAQLLAKNPEPFHSVEFFQDRTGTLGKYWSKRQCLMRLKELVIKLKPIKVFGGNDRRVEFQYVMHQAQAICPQVIGAYLDDGIGSYINGVYINKWRAIIDLTADRLLKRIFYGSWYDKQRLLGGTRWVRECYLNFPELAPDRLARDKTIIGLEPEIFRGPAFSKLLERFICTYDQRGAGAFPVNHFYAHYDAFLILPHSKLIGRHFSSVQHYNKMVNEYLRQFKSVAVKYHPRETHFYFESDAEVTVFPGLLSAEIIFSFIEVDCVVGDLSSALLSAVWLLPNSRAVCLCPETLKASPILQLIERTQAEIVYY